MFVWPVGGGPTSSGRSQVAILGPFHFDLVIARKSAFRVTSKTSSARTGGHQLQSACTIGRSPLISGCATVMKYIDARRKCPAPALIWRALEPFRRPMCTPASDFPPDKAPLAGRKSLVFRLAGRPLVIDSASLQFGARVSRGQPARPAKMEWGSTKPGAQTALFRRPAWAQINYRPGGARPRASQLNVRRRATKTSCKWQQSNRRAGERAHANCSLASLDLASLVSADPGARPRRPPANSGGACNWMPRTRIANSTGNTLARAQSAGRTLFELAMIKWPIRAHANGHLRRQWLRALGAGALA